MKISLRVSLVISYLAVILVGMGIAALLAWLAVERLYLDTQRENLLAQAQTAAAALKGTAPSSGIGVAQPEVPAYSQMMNTIPGIHTRLIDAQGSAIINTASVEQAPPGSGVLLPQLAQNDSGMVTAGELLSRPEIAQALQGQPATAARQVEAAGGRRVMYAAAPVFSEAGQVTQIVYLAMPLPDMGWWSLPAQLRWQLAGALLVAFLLAGTAGLLLARLIARPLVKLAGAATAVAGGDLNQAVPESEGIRELAVLGQAFNRMTTNLRQSDMAKNAFVADVSHELRTPLTVIKGTIETLQDGAIDDLPARERFLAAMSVETERLIRMVNQLLVLTRADAGALGLQICPVELGELARSRCEYLSAAAARRGARLSVAAGSAQYFVQADADRLAQVLDNLLDNAIRYSPAGGQVTVSLSSEGGEVLCQVTDQGPGIPAKHLPLIFERFYRADASRHRAQGSSGLGLSIVRALVTAHGGRVSASSVEGQGTTISFWLTEA